MLSLPLLRFVSLQNSRLVHVDDQIHKPSGHLDESRVALTGSNQRIYHSSPRQEEERKTHDILIYGMYTPFIFRFEVTEAVDVLGQIPVPLSIGVLNMRISVDQILERT